MLKIKKNILTLFFRSFISFLLISNIFSQNDEIMIMDIIVEGNNRLTSQDIQRNARIYKGMSIKGPEIQQAIKRLWNLERFYNIQILIDNETLDGIYLRIIVDENPNLGEINFKGNKKKSSRSLEEDIDLKSGQILNPNSIFEAMEKIKELYSEKHYHSIEIDTIFTFSEEKHIKNLTFVINEGKKNKIKKINFAGNNIFSDNKLSKIFKDNKAKKWYAPWRGAWKKDLLQSDKELLYNFYKNKGYRDFYIIDESVNISNDKSNIELSFKIYEGPQYKIRNISWEGNYLHDSKKLNSRLNFYKGDIFFEDKFQLALSERVNPLYSDAGYFYFQAIPSYMPVGEDSLDIHFDITENQIVHVRKINIKGNKRTFDNVIRRELRVYPGDIFSRKKLMDSYRDIFMLNFFDNVIPNVIPINDEEIDIELEVFEKSTGQANFSMGYNGIHGFTGGGGFEFPNFRGRGQTLSISYQRGLNSSANSNSMSNYSSTNYSNNQNSSAYQSFSLNFVEPRLLDTPNLIGASFFYTEQGQGQNNYLPFDIKKHGGSLRLGRRFKWPDYFFRGSWMLRGSKNTYIADNPMDFSQSFDLDNITIDQNDNMFSFSSSGISLTQIITRDSRNHPEFPTSGSKSILTSTLSGSFLGGNQDFHKHEIDLNWFTPLHNKVTISQIFKFGSLKGINRQDSQRSIIPPGVRFIMGGTGIPQGEMLRGYKENKVGPYSGTRGGDVMLRYSLELRLLLSESPTIYTLSFFDMGNVWSEFDVLDPFDLKRSAGVGIRVFIPMLGMLGYDIGYGFDSTEYNEYINSGSKKPNGWEYHLIFGMPF